MRTAIFFGLFEVAKAINPETSGQWMLIPFILVIFAMDFLGFVKK